MLPPLTLKWYYDTLTPTGKNVQNYSYDPVELSYRFPSVSVPESFVQPLICWFISFQYLLINSWTWSSILIHNRRLALTNQLRCISNHVSICGHEVADTLAKLSSNFTSYSFSLIDGSNFIPILRRHICSLKSAYWNNLPTTTFPRFKSMARLSFIFYLTPKKFVSKI